MLSLLLFDGDDEEEDSSRSHTIHATAVRWNEVKYRSATSRLSKGDPPLLLPAVPPLPLLLLGAYTVCRARSTRGSSSSGSELCGGSCS